MVGWHHQLDGHGFGWTLGAGDGQGGPVCCSSWGHRESDTTEQLNWAELNFLLHSVNVARYIHFFRLYYPCILGRNHLIMVYNLLNILLNQIWQYQQFLHQQLSEILVYSFFLIPLVLWRSFVQLWLYKRSLPVSRWFSCEKFSSCRCVFAVFVAKGGFHVFLLCHLDIH